MVELVDAARIRRQLNDAVKRVLCYSLILGSADLA